MKEQVLEIENSFNSIIELEKINPNFQNESYTKYLFNDEEKLIESNRDKFEYNEQGKLKSIISISPGNLVEENKTFLTSFEYFGESVLKKTVLIKSESFFSANDIAYTTDGINTIKDKPILKNELTNVETISFDLVESITNRKLLFNNEIDYTTLKLNEEQEDIQSITDNLVITENKIITEFGNTIIERKNYLKNYNLNSFLLTEVEIQVKYKTGAEYGCNYDSNGNIIEFSNLEQYNPDTQVEYYDSRKGIYKFGYGENHELNYLETPQEIAIISRLFINNCKTEIGNIIKKRNQKVELWYKLYEKTINI